MRQLKLWFGALSIGVGLTGVVLSIFCVVMLWRFDALIAQRTTEFADLANAVKQSADEYVGQAEGVLVQMQQKVGILKQSAEAMSAEAMSAETTQNRDITPVIDRLDAELIRELREARNVLTSIQSGSDGLNEAVKQFELLVTPMRMLRKSGETDGDSDLRALSRSLTEVSELIQQVIDFVTRMEQQGITDKQAQQMNQAVQRLGAVLERGHLRLTSFRESLDKASSSLEAKREQVPRWARMTAVVSTVFFVCFGFTQIHLIGKGWAGWVNLRRTPAAQNDTPVPTETSGMNQK